MDADNYTQFKIRYRGEKTINEVNVLFMDRSSKAEGSTLNNMAYCMEVDVNTCSRFIGIVDQQADAKYSEALTKMINSVIKKT